MTGESNETIINDGARNRYFLLKDTFFILPIFLKLLVFCCFGRNKLGNIPLLFKKLYNFGKKRIFGEFVFKF